MTDRLRTKGGGFYRANGINLESANRICAPGFELHKHLKDTYDYPVAGWSWFESEAEARAAFGLPPADAVPRGRGRDREPRRQNPDA